MLKETESEETKGFLSHFIIGGITLMASPLSQKPTVSKQIFDDVIILQLNCLGHFYTFHKFFIVSARQGHREKRQGGTMTPVPMDFRGPMYFRKAAGLPELERGASKRL